MKYTALGEGLVANIVVMTNIALGFTSTIFATRLSPQAVYFIQTGGSALSNTYGALLHYNGLLVQTVGYHGFRQYV